MTTTEARGILDRTRHVWVLPTADTEHLQDLVGGLPQSNPGHLTHLYNPKGPAGTLLGVSEGSQVIRGPVLEMACS